MLVGLAGIALGLVLGRRMAARCASKPTFGPIARWSQIAGIMLGLGSVFFERFLSYPLVGIGAKTGRAYGIPFLLVIFDDQGRDYVSSLMWLFMVGNCVFCYFIPRFLVFVVLGLRRRESPW